jgi:epoxyqueuosine reductase
MNLVKDLEEKLSQVAPYMIRKVKKSEALEWLQDFNKKYGGGIDLSAIEQKSGEGIVVLALGYNLHKTDFKNEEMSISPYYYFSNIYYQKMNMVLEELKGKGFKVNKIDQAHLKTLANLSGIGYYGKNSIIHNDEFGSQMFLYAFTTDESLEWDEINYKLSDCGDCTICVESCPNKALEDYKLIREKCIRNYTLEGKYIPDKIRDTLGSRLIGCDKCQTVCPKNFGKNEDLPIMNIQERELLLPDLYLKNWEKGLKTHIRKLGDLIGYNYARTNRVLVQSIISAGNIRNKDLTNELKTLQKHQDKNIVQYSNWAVRKINNGSDKNEY